MKENQVHIEEDGEAVDRWRVRTLPLGIDGAAGTTYVPAFQCLRAPYWKKTARVMSNEPVQI